MGQRKHIQMPWAVRASRKHGMGWAKVRMTWTEWLGDISNSWPGVRRREPSCCESCLAAVRGPRKVLGLPVGCPKCPLRDRLEVLAFLMAAVTTPLQSLRSVPW